MKYKLILSPQAEEDIFEHAKAGNKYLLKKYLRFSMNLRNIPKQEQENPNC